MINLDMAWAKIVLPTLLAAVVTFTVWMSELRSLMVAVIVFDFIMLFLSAEFVVRRRLAMRGPQSKQ